MAELNKAEAVKKIVSMHNESEKLRQQLKQLVMDLIKTSKAEDVIDAGEAGVFKVVTVTDMHLAEGVVMGRWGSSGLIKL